MSRNDASWLRHISTPHYILEVCYKVRCLLVKTPRTWGNSFPSHKSHGSDRTDLGEEGRCGPWLMVEIAIVFQSCISFYPSCNSVTYSANMERFFLRAQHDSQGSAFQLGRQLPRGEKAGPLGAPSKPTSPCPQTVSTQLDAEPGEGGTLNQRKLEGLHPCFLVPPGLGWGASPPPTSTFCPSQLRASASQEPAPSVP